MADPLNLEVAAKAERFAHKRAIQSETTAHVFSYPSVNGYGINSEGFTVYIQEDTPEIRSSLPTHICNFPVTVKFAGVIESGPLVVDEAEER